MYLPIPQQPDCLTAWRQAVQVVMGQPGHECHNVIIDIVDPIANSGRHDSQFVIVDDFLLRYEKSVETIANTIFPSGLYHLYGAPKFFDVFENLVLKKVRKTERWSGYYFERMMQYPASSGKSINQLWNIISRMKTVSALNKFELALFDPARDVDNSPYGGQCLSFLSFKIVPNPERTQRTLMLTAIYRNHFYIEKLLGNLIGLGRLMAFVAKEADLKIGHLTVVSTHAQIDHPGKVTLADIKAVLSAFDQAKAATSR